MGSVHGINVESIVIATVGAVAILSLCTSGRVRVAVATV
jgi:hypothetical protein